MYLRVTILVNDCHLDDHCEQYTEFEYFTDIDECYQYIHGYGGMHHGTCNNITREYGGIDIVDSIPTNDW